MALLETGQAGDDGGSQLHRANVSAPSPFNNPRGSYTGGLSATLYCGCGGIPAAVLTHRTAPKGTSQRNAQRNAYEPRLREGTGECRRAAGAPDLRAPEPRHVRGFEADRGRGGAFRGG